MPEDSGENKMRVAVRVRPLNTRELEQNQTNIIRVLDSSNMVFDPDQDEDEFFFHGAKQTHRDITKRVKKKLSMEFDSVFDEAASNHDVFTHCTKPLILKVLDGYNCSVFVYGATGAGKTFTMLGSEDTPGITFLTMKELFDIMDIQSEAKKFDIGISYLEVYNELVMNLLTKSGPLKLREDATGVVVVGLVLKQIHNAEELLELLALGNRNRTQHPTDANSESSRSHAIFQVHIRITDKKSNIRRTVKLSMIDLAGSERAQSTKCTGLRFKEGANINKSLLALGNCINRLADGSKHIPYRDSNLTRILKDSLGGNCRTLMIANISPSSLTYEDTYNTLKYAGRAKKITTTCRQNVIQSNMPKEYLLKRCTAQADEIERLKARIRQLETLLDEQQKKTVPQTPAALEPPIQDNFLLSTVQKKQEDVFNVWAKKIDAVYAEYRKSHEMCLTVQSKEKILNFRIKLKEHSENVKKLLPLDGARLDFDIGRLEASIDKYTKQVSRIKNEEMTRCLKRLKETNGALESLKREVLSMDNAMLQTYIEKKDIELENSKVTIKSSHVNKINSVLQADAENWKKATLLSSEIIQDNFLLFRSEMDCIMTEKLQTLVKLYQGQRSVKFEDDESANGTFTCSPAKHPGQSAVYHDILNLSDYAEHSQLQSPSSTVKKRCHSDEEEGIEEIKKTKNDDFDFARPKAVKSINFNGAHSSKTVSSEIDLNVTFDLNQQPSKTALATKNTIKTSSSISAVSKALKSRPIPSATLRLPYHINKENAKRFSPNRVRKSSRTPNKVSGKAPASLANRPKLIKSASALVTSSTDKFKKVK